MKNLLTLLLVFAGYFSAAQVKPLTIGDKNVPTKILGKTVIETSLILPDTAQGLILSDKGALAYKNGLYTWNGIKWDLGLSGSGTPDTLRYGGPITSIATVGYNPNTKSIAAWIDSVFYQSQSPTTTITGGQVLEFRSTQTMNFTLNYTSGRQLATKPLSSIIIGGNTKSFSQPIAGSSVSGTQSVSFAANTDVTYQNVTTTIDSKIANASTTFSFLPKRYFGWISDTTGIGQAGFDDSKITSLGNELSNSKSKTFSTGSPTGTQFYVYAYYSTAGDLTQWDMNGFPSLAAMNKSTRNFTNALGFTGTWTIYWSKNGQTQSSTVVAN